MGRISLQMQILLGMAAGLCFAILSIKLGWPASFATSYIKPFGTIFLNSLKVVAIPLIIASMITGVTNIEDTAKLSRIGRKTVLLFVGTTLFAAVLGLLVVNFFQPGTKISPD